MVKIRILADFVRIVLVVLARRALILSGYLPHPGNHLTPSVVLTTWYLVAPPKKKAISMPNRIVRRETAKAQ
jgi:hypothetical protein